MSFKEIKELIEILDNSNLTEINVESKGNNVTLKKEKEVIRESVQAQPVHNQPAQPQAPVNTSDQSNQGSNDQEDDGTQKITAPMVGTFYKAPSPDEPAYVQVGDKVSNESTVCILEAMKLFNEIQAEVSGEIVEILVEDGQMVEYGQPLFKVK
ncbi:acetyl-CoA carboxylase biotin carboxyl carrier protein [Staphylococcus massiliensis]|uniref:Biotin carboxyl carrier protein of acetyl-CoA carboxylase n=1 Tax=Staphylococcus massiliensis S46 TaxID=1229783 RepID=K9ARH1_9STAP|nr:acetyl-CoA carboxylase biotin carboxyl carrier protein [Staphylococcus massiliensis]EKU49859.1 putative acetyl-CoA carboxylase biotin carboxyl carrier subunit [Staphylococcus massiliensis S46]POA02049.1 acetyl-CoA carboxylase biotin carboxyl carrier protein [Staphylococcus massiliensis CCUG 55927]